MEPGERIVLFSVALLGIALLAFGAGQWTGRTEPDPAANIVHVPQGALDTDYAFVPGGTAGDVRVYGLPSGRLLQTLPVFEPRGAHGYATEADPDGRNTLKSTGGLRGDVSQLAHRGSLLYAVDKLYGRLARISLNSFRVTQMAQITDMQAPSDVAAHSESAYVVVVGQSGSRRTGLVTFLDRKTLTSVFHVALGANPIRCEFSPDTEWVFVSASWPRPEKNYMASRKTGSVYAIDINKSKDALSRPEVLLGVSGAPIKGKGFEVRNVTPGTPAAAAGLAQGDLIANLKDVTLRKPGRSFTLPVTSSGKQRMVKLTLGIPILPASLVARDIPVGRHPAGLAIHKDYLLASCRSGKTVAVIDIRQATRRTLALAKGITSQAAPVKQGKVPKYRPLSQSEISNSIKAEVSLGNGPTDSVVDHQGHVYTGLYTGSEVVKWDLQRAIDGRSDYVIKRTSVPYQVTGMARGTATVLALCARSSDQYLPTGPLQVANLVLLGSRSLSPLTQSPLGSGASGAIVINANHLTVEGGATPTGALAPPASGLTRQGKTTVTVILHHQAAGLGGLD